MKPIQSARNALLVILTGFCLSKGATGSTSLRLVEKRTYDSNRSLLQKRTWKYKNFTGLMLSSKSENPIFSLESRFEYEYDAQGRLTREFWIEREGVVGGRIEYSYSSDGFTVEKRHYESAAGNTSPMRTVLYTFDAHGRCRTMREAFNNHSDYGRLRTYDFVSGERMGLVNTYDRQDALSFQDLYNYSPQGHLTSIERKEERGNLLCIDEFTYDSAGKVIKITSSIREADGKLSLRHISTYQYDKRGALLQESSFAGNGKLETYTIFRYEEGSSSPEFFLTEDPLQFIR